MKKLLLLLAFILLPQIASAQVVPFMSKGLVGHYTFNGTNIVNGVMKDITDNTNAYFRNIATSTSFTQGKLGQAMVFNGSDQWVDAGTSPTAGATGITVAVWVNPRVSGSFMLLEDAISFDQNTFYFYLNGGVPEAEIYAASSPGGYDAINTGVDLPLGKWSHYVMTWNAGERIKIYVNGVDAGGSYVGGSALQSGPLITPSDNLTIGGRPSGGGLGLDYDGKMDDVRVYNRGLSATEVRQLYNYGSTKLTSPTFLTNGLLGYWKLNDAGGTSAVDSSGNANTATLINGPTWNFGKVGGAVNFPGSGFMTAQTAAAASNLDSLTAFSVSGWYYPQGYGQNGLGYYFSKGDAGTSGYNLSVDSSSRYIVTVAYSTTNITVVADFPSSDATYFNKWHHIVITHDGSTTAANLKIYDNGTELTHTFNQNGVGTLGSDTGTAFFIGNSSTYGRTFEGKVDEMRVYNRALSESEVQQLYRFGINTLVTPPSETRGLIGWWTFDGKDTPSRALDRSGQNTTGYFSGIATSTFYSIGKIGQSLNFDGVNDGVSLNNTNLSPTSAVTVSAWMKTSSLPIYTQIMGNNDGGTNGYQLWYNTDDSCCASNSFIFSLNSYGSLEADKSFTADGKWHHVVGTYDGANTKIYIDGVKGNDGTISNAITYTGATATIGGGAINFAPFSGNIDDVRVYNRALSATEVRQLYNNGTSVIK